METQGRLIIHETAGGLWIHHFFLLWYIYYVMDPTCLYIRPSYFFACHLLYDTSKESYSDSCEHSRRCCTCRCSSSINQKLFEDPFSGFNRPWRFIVGFFFLCFHIRKVASLTYRQQFKFARFFLSYQKATVRINFVCFIFMIV